ncbi:MAG: hypothetical protein K5753_03840 [Clostridia bacterium]|nr:hypothetical protein [Clostridia bacterium]
MTNEEVLDEYFANLHIQHGDEGASFKYIRDYIGVEEVMARLGVKEAKAYEMLRVWKFQLRKEGRDKLDLPAKITIEDYCHVLGLDIRRFF